VPLMVPRRVMERQVLAMTPPPAGKPRVPAMMPRVPVMMPRVPVMMPRLVMVPRVLAGEALAGLPPARAAEVAQEAVCAKRHPPARVCRSSISP